MKETLMKRVYASMIEQDLESYRALFNEPVEGDDIIDYWKDAWAFYGALDECQKEIFFSILKTVMTDTVSTVFGALDGTVGIDDEDWNFQVSVNGIDMTGELQDLFLEHVEEMEAAGGL